MAVCETFQHKMNIVYKYKNQIVIDYKQKELLFIESTPHVINYFSMNKYCPDTETIHKVKTALFQGTCNDKELISYVENKLNTTFPKKDIAYTQEWNLFFQGCVLKHYWNDVEQQPYLWDRELFKTVLREFI